MFLEYDINDAPASRLSRFRAGFDGVYATFPMVMVDSGHSTKDGPVAYISAYSAMVDASLPRVAKGQVQAFWARQGNKVNFSVQVKNLDSQTLSTSNGATVHVIVYQQQHLVLTDRFVVDTVNTPISSLASGATGVYQLQTGDLVGVDWSKLHYIALVDYRPSALSAAYDTLQAAVAVPLAQVKPDQLVFLVDNSVSTVPSQFAQVEGQSSLIWSASESAPWLTVTASGSPATPAQFSVNRGALVSGWQEAVVSFSSTDGGLSDQVTVKAYLGDLIPVFLPIARK